MVSAPYGANRVLAAITFLNDRSQEISQGVGFSQGRLHAGRFMIAQGIIEIGVQQFTVDGCHGVCSRKRWPDDTHFILFKRPGGFSSNVSGSDKAER